MSAPKDEKPLARVPFERVAFAAHQAECSACRSEVRATGAGRCAEGNEIARRDGELYCARLLEAERAESGPVTIAATLGYLDGVKRRAESN